MNICQSPAIRVDDDRVAETIDDVCIEESFRVYLNNEFICELVASPSQLEELGAGHVICEGLASGVSGVQVSGDEIRVHVETPEERCTTESSESSESSVTIEKEHIFEVMDSLVSEIWEITGGAHCSLLFSDGRLIARSEDIGRHNTVDKVVGYAILNNIDLSTCILGCSGRQPAMMVSKAANAGIPIVISRSAATDKGIRTADLAGVTLICFARGNRFTVYAHPDRIILHQGL
ncbi:MAG: formate dehydrogenase accessory sulfurtransferase FdhD [Candidatus Methanogaster sp.]|uniref:Formate dehydrogenase accessory sulfurtransferase FdhD n=1 Tax=Candidatus Methanogaster sp. TaxID=3386292 RepID=A0AC61L420_9EURY|nr:MAG: formate dehydrogenase accessory sulfurtransferase FdhD [ANME-2 cluster archaeon]